MRLEHLVTKVDTTRQSISWMFQHRLGTLVVLSSTFLLVSPTILRGSPVTTPMFGNHPFELVATAIHLDKELFTLTSDPSGNVYAGCNTFTNPGIPLQKFDPIAYAANGNNTIPLADFGAVNWDADGVTYGNGYIYAPDRSPGGGVRRTPLASPNSSSIVLPGVATNLNASPLALRESDNHLFNGLGFLGVARIDEYDASALPGTTTPIHQWSTATAVETMSLAPAVGGPAGTIYYANYDANVRALDLNTGLDSFVGTLPNGGQIDGGLTYDPLSGLLFAGQAVGSGALRDLYVLDPNVPVWQRHPVCHGFWYD